MLARGKHPARKAARPINPLDFLRRIYDNSQEMSNKLRVSYELDLTDANARIAIVRMLQALMDWVQIAESDWLVLANRHNAATLQERIKNFLKSKNSRVVVKDVKKKKIENEGYLNSKNDEASEVLFTSKF
jgi:hypothetical protein